ncbi:ATP-binding SpoIIE family protein phosphatase [Cellulomonas sp. NS3]|uniref:ATP-binding SpoIIE family protein phosphatase n=1 Tax=Cellulomonas sp. NS3 TaxID=2973977 RepID=UPI00216284A3|nr:SpoIIE family protein phosphatase [Cellulomonas sp. NS3]
MRVERDELSRAAPGGVVDFRRVFATSPTAYLVLDRDLVIVEVNPAYTALVGRSREQVVGRPVFEVFPPDPGTVDEDGRHPLQVSLERVRDTGRPQVVPLAKYDVVVPAGGGRVERFWSLTLVPLPDLDGAPDLILERVEDVTAYVAERRAHGRDAPPPELLELMEADLYVRLQQLGAAQEARDLAARRVAGLGEVALQLTSAETVQDLERIVLAQGPRVLGAAGGALFTRDDAGGWRVSAAALGEHVQARYQHLPFDSPLAGPWVARTGRRLLLPTRASGIELHPTMAAAYADTQRDAWAILPLTVRDACVGALAVSWVDERDFDAEELELLESLAAQCAQALDRLMALQAEREAAAVAARTSETLQRSLLSPPPQVDGLEIAVRYVPAAKATQVGGDWYDAFLQRSGEPVVVIGDVVGHDIDAAAAMGQLRAMLRGIAVTAPASPVELVRAVDRAIDTLELPTVATGLVARVERAPYDPDGDDRVVRWSNAGHLPPLVAHPDGSVTELTGERTNLLLGINPEAERDEWTTRVGAGSVLFLYTDGLVERRGESVPLGIEALRARLAASAGAPLETLCDDVLDAMLPPHPHDDVAVVAIRVRRAGEQATVTAAVPVTEERVPVAPDAGGAAVDRRTLRVPAVPQSAHTSRHWVVDVAREHGASEPALALVKLLTSEVVTNAVKYGLVRDVVTVTATCAEGVVTVAVQDDNPDLPRVRHARREDTGGRGMELVERFAEEWGTDVSADGDGKGVWFRLRLDRATVHDPGPAPAT